MTETSVALVTGSSSGIGAAIAARLAAAGTRVVVNSARSVRTGKEVADALPDAVYVHPDVWREILGTNVLGTWQVTVAAVPHLRASGAGSIVNISSIAGSRPAGSSIPYAVSKAAIEHMTRLLAGALGPEIRVNAVAPGLVDTLWTAGEAFTKIRQQVEAITPLRRVGTRDDVAEAVLALIGCSYTTGQVLMTDGGAHLR